MRLTMRRIVCAVVLVLAVGTTAWGMPVASRGAIAVGTGSGPVAYAGGALTPEARDNLRWAGLSITIYCIFTHRLGM